MISQDSPVHSTAPSVPTDSNYEFYVDSVGAGGNADPFVHLFIEVDKIGAGSRTVDTTIGGHHGTPINFFVPFPPYLINAPSLLSGDTNEEFVPGSNQLVNIRQHVQFLRPDKYATTADYFQALLDGLATYNTNQEFYEVAAQDFPTLGLKGYNSNSFVTGLLEYTGVSNSIESVGAPLAIGANKPVPYTDFAYPYSHFLNLIDGGTNTGGGGGENVGIKACDYAWVESGGPWGEGGVELQCDDGVDKVFF